MLNAKQLTHVSALLLLSSSVSAAGLYPQNSGVLQVDSTNYEKLIGKSNYTSIVEFYAPWCGHCQNLKPAYEKVAKSLAGYAKVAAVNCDEDSNKPLCGRFGIKGFPTLKIVKPAKKKGGSPIVEDYNGERTAKAIHEVLTDKIPNHVVRPKDEELDDWLKKTTIPKVLFFTEKRVVGSMVKALAIDFLGAANIAQISATQKKIVEDFEVQTFPSVYVVLGADDSLVKYDGEIKKQPIKDFISKYASPNPEYPSASAGSNAKPAAAKKDAKSGAAKAKAKADSGEASCPMGHTGKNPHTVGDGTGYKEPEPSPPPEPKAEAEDSEPVKEPAKESSKESTGPLPTMEPLDTKEELARLCLNTRVGTCLLALAPSSLEEAQSSLSGLREIADKHAARRMKLFPFYTVPNSNAAVKDLMSTLDTAFDKEKTPVILVINLKKGWWNKYSGSSLGAKDLENWIDNIRFGDFKKTKLAEEVVAKILGSGNAGMKDEL